MLLETHAHTCRHSACSRAAAEELIRQAVKKNLQGIVLTDHHYLWSPDEIAGLRRAAEVDSTFLVLAGQEVETEIGHVLVFGGDGTAEKGTELRELRRLFPSAALVWAHPFRSGRVPSDEDLRNPLLDGIEIFSLNHTPKENYAGLSLWHRLKFTALGGSDAHAAQSSGVLPTQFDHPVESIAEVAAEIRAGRCRPFFKEIPKAGSNIVVTMITLGTKGDDEYRSRLVMKKVASSSAWERVSRSLDLVSRLHRSGFRGGTFRVPEVIEVNPEERIVIEEGARGKRLFELLPAVEAKVGMEYFQLAARWLSRLHNLKLRAGEPDETVARGRKKFSSYREAFRRVGNPHLGTAEAILDAVEIGEEEIGRTEGGRFVLVHGDYHPKNIIIGQDRMQDISTLFVSVIDFDSAFLCYPAYDVGYFVSQFRHQFRLFPALLQTCREEDFLRAYLAAAVDPSPDFSRQAALARLRANMSIASFLIKVGKGIGEEMDGLIGESGELLDRLRSAKKGSGPRADPWNAGAREAPPPMD